MQNGIPSSPESQGPSIRPERDETDPFPFGPFRIFVRILAIVAIAEIVESALGNAFDLPTGLGLVDPAIIAAISAPFVYFWVVRDITRRLTAHAALARTALKQELVLKAYEDQLALRDYAETVVASVPSGLVMLSTDLYALSVNRAFREMFSITDRDVVGQPLEKVLPGVNPWRLAAEVLGTDQSDLAISVDVTDSRGARHLQLTLTRFRQVGEGARLLLVVEDITGRKLAEQRLNTLAHYDPLTGLPNRMLFQDRLTQALAHARRERRMVGLLYLDLDRFKLINDTLGHTVGDELLKAVAQRLVGCVRSTNAVSRLGGDEFTVILPALTSPQGSAVVARKILRAVSQPITIQGHDISITPSIGITVFPTDGSDFDGLLKNADAAMYRAKERGNAYQFYEPEMHSRALDRLALENRLRRALERGEFVVHYQPQVDLATRRVVGIEALVRWPQPDGEVVPPGEFIPLAEETGLIIPIGEWVLRTACAQNRAWQDAGLPPVRVSVNFSIRQVTQIDLPDVVKRALKTARLDPRYLELELTESSLMRNAEETTAALDRLNAMGVVFSIDDFGTGYSSLSYLRRFPIHALKIGQGFIRDVTTNPDDAAIVTTIIAMAHSLNMRVVAEGVERAAQLSVLRAQGCDVIQGHLVSRALSADEVAPFLREGWRMDESRAA